MRDALPYLVPASEAVTFLPWTTTDGDPVAVLADGWDPATSLVMTRRLEIDVPRVRREARLGADVPLQVNASWRSSTSAMVRSAGHADVGASGVAVLQARLPGAEIGGVLTITTTVTVAVDWDSPLAAAGWAGCILARDEFLLSLAGDAPQFPIEVVDFDSTAWDPDASWHLTIKSDLGAPFLGTCWLSINSRDAALLKAIGASRRTAADTALLDAMYADVGEQLLAAAELAGREGDIADVEWPAESLGAVLSVLLRQRGTAPDSPQTMGDLADQRTARQGVVRRLGTGRRF